MLLGLCIHAKVQELINHDKNVWLVWLYLILYTPISVCIFYNSSVDISLSADKENLCNNKELPLSVIMSFIFINLMCNSGVM